MGSQHNRLRAKWQDYGGSNAASAENAFFTAFKTIFEGTELQIRSKPKEFSNLYVNFPLPDHIQAQIHCPEVAITRHGVFPDYAIDNQETGKTLYVEVKRQDGWIEGGKRSDGRGNAHERSCKFFTPGLLHALREKGNIDEPSLPFWVVLQGAIARDPCRVREVTYWYKGCEDHFFFWRDSPDPIGLIAHFEDKLLAIIS